MNLSRLGIGLCLAFVLTAISGSAQPKFAHETSDLRPDAAVRFGILPNGIRYAILANHEPQNRASLRLGVAAGSLNEDDNQRGLAHFIEHMAFNGTTHYPTGLIERLQQLGMGFGNDTNAGTGFDKTTYKLELPDNKSATLQEGFTVLSDYAGGMLLDIKEIDKERGIILSEKRARDSVEYRIFVAEYSVLLAGTRLPLRLPIGEADIISNATRDRFTSFYDTWYRPDNMVVIAVGDFDPAAVEIQLKDAFAGLTARAPAQPKPDLGKIASKPGVHVQFLREPEAAKVSVSIQTITPYAKEPDNAQNRIKDLPRSIATGVINRRLAILSKKENAGFTAGTTNIGESYDFFRSASISMTCRPEQWRSALTTAEQELRRALEFGFQPAEVKEITASYRNYFEQAVKTASTRRSERLAENLTTSLLDTEVFTHPESDLALFGPAIDKITPEACLAALRAAWDADHRFISINGNVDIAAEAAKAGTPAPTVEDFIRGTFKDSAAVKLVAPDKIADQAFAYTDFGPAGVVKSKTHVADLDLWLVEFANGVRLNVKKTEFEANKIRINVRIGTGRLTEPANKPGLSFVANSIYTTGGLGKHSIDDIQRLFAGRTLSWNFGVRDDALSLGGTTNREDFLFQLQLLTAGVIDPGYRPESLRQAKKSFDQLFNKIATTPQGPLQTEAPVYLASGDTRFGLPSRDILFSHTIEDVRAWLTPQFKDGAVEIAIVGDIDPETAINATAATFGTLPARAAKPALTEARKVAPPSVPAAKTYSVSTAIPKTIVTLYWPTTDATNAPRTRRLNMLANVFNDRLRVKIREQMGSTYSPDAGHAPSETYTDYGFLLAQVLCDPEQSTAIGDAIIAISDDMTKNGITAEELDRSRKPVLTSIRESIRSNGYWLSSVLSQCQETPDHLDRVRNRQQDIESITTTDLDALAKQYLGANRAIRITSQPAPKPEPAQ